MQLETNDLITWNIGKYKFYDLHSLGTPYYYVHPAKQLAMYHVMERARDRLDIQAIIVFGSSVHDYHFFRSDLDLCLIGILGGDFRYKELECADISFDFLKVESFPTLFKLSQEPGSVYQRICREGVLFIC